MNIFALSGLLIGITGGIEAILMFVKGRRKFHYLWGIFCISVLMWGLGGYEIAITLDPVKSVLWWRIAYIGVIFIPIFLLHFTYEFLEISRKWTIIIFYVLGFIFLVLNLTSDLFIDKVRLVFEQFYYISPPAPLYTPFVLMFFGLVVYSLFKLWQAYRMAQGVRRAQLKYIFIALVIGFAGGSFSFFPVYKIDFYPILNLTVFLGILIVAYAILKYRLMDIRIVARKAFIYFGVAAFTYGMFYLVAWIYTQAFGSVFATTGYLAGLIIAPTFVLGFYSLGKVLLKIANKYFFAGLYSYQATIAKLSEELNYLTNLKEIVDAIVDTIKNTMQLERAGVLLIDETKKPIHYQVAKILGFKEENGINLVKDNFLTRHLQKTQVPLVREELDFLIREAKTQTDKQGFLRLKSQMTRIEASLGLPLMSSNKLIGIIILGPKLSGDAYTKEDLELLNTLSFQAGIAVENARLYKEVQDFSKILQKKVDEQTQEIRKKSEHLEELLQMKTDFLRVVSHQLNTPLSLMRNAIFMLAEGSIPQGKAVKIAKSGLERLSNTLDDFWHAFALEGEEMPMEKKKTDISEIIKKILAEKKQAPKVLERKLKLMIKKPKFRIPSVFCDPQKIVHVISNLLDNAISYTPKGRVTIFYSLVAKNFLKISVQDTGIGITEKDKEKLFQKFSRSKRAVLLQPNGSGLGLYIAKRIIEINGGKISVESEGEGRGSTFSFTLPIFKE